MPGSRANLLNKKFKVNQIRNGIYWYINYLKVDKNIGTVDIIGKLREMGKKIALTYINYWKPKYKDTIDLMRVIHRTVFKTAARVRESDSEIVVISRSCPLCKYRRENIDVPGCNILVGFIEKFYELLSKDNPDLPKIEGTIETSRIFGEKKCKYTFKTG